MKTFEQALEEAKRKLEPYEYGNSREEQEDAFAEGAKWVIANLNLIPAKDLLKHEDVRKILKYVRYQEKLLICHRTGKSPGKWLFEMEELREALKPFEDET